MSAFGGEADIGRTEDDRNELLSVAKTGIEPSLLRSSAFADVHLFGGSNPVGQFQKYAMGFNGTISQSGTP